MFGIKKRFTKISLHAGYTLIEMLLVISIIAIISGVVVLAINPNKQLAEARNTKRRADIEVIINAVYQYIIDSGGRLPDSIRTDDVCNTAANEICQFSQDCTATDLSILLEKQKYLTLLPFDPQKTSVQGTSYYIAKNQFGRITVCAPLAEQNAIISTTR